MLVGFFVKSHRNSAVRLTLGKEILCRMTKKTQADSEPVHIGIMCGIVYIIITDDAAIVKARTGGQQ